MTFKDVLIHQQTLIDEYTMVNKNARFNLERLQKISEELEVPFEDMEIKTLAKLCNTVRTRKSFLNFKTSLKGFYLYLGCDDIVSQIPQITFNNDLKYYPCLEKLVEEIDSAIIYLYNTNEIVDVKRYDNCKTVLILEAFGIDIADIAKLKRQDYNFTQSTLNVNGNIINLPSYINQYFKEYVYSDGFDKLHNGNIVRENYIESDSFVKRMRKSNVNSERVQFLYRYNETASKNLHIEFVSVRKSKEMWDILLTNGYDTSNQNIVATVDWDKALNFLTPDTYKISKSEVESFTECLKIYQQSLFRKNFKK